MLGEGFGEFERSRMNGNCKGAFQKILVCTVLIVCVVKGANAACHLTVCSEIGRL